MTLTINDDDHDDDNDSGVFSLDSLCEHGSTRLTPHTMEPVNDQTHYKSPAPPWRKARDTALQL